MASASSQAQGTAAEGAEASGSRSNLAPCRVDDASRRMHTPDGQYRIDCSEIGYAQPSVVSCFVALAEFWAAAGRPSHRTPWSRRCRWPTGALAQTMLRHAHKRGGLSIVEADNAVRACVRVPTGCSAPVRTASFVSPSTCRRSNVRAPATHAAAATARRRPPCDTQAPFKVVFF